MLKKIADKPYRVLFLVIPIILMSALLRIGNSMDIQLHNTYYVVEPLHFGLLLSIFFSCLGGLYWLVRKKKLIDWMTKAHVLTTVIGLFLIIVFWFLSDKTSGINDYEHYKAILWIIIIGTFFWLFCQLMFLINLTVGAFRNIKK